MVAKKYRRFRGGDPSDPRPKLTIKSPNDSDPSSARTASPRRGSPAKNSQSPKRGSPRRESPKRESPKRESPKFYLEPIFAEPELEHINESAFNLIKSIDTNTLKLDRRVHYSKTLHLEIYRFGLDVVEQKFEKYFDEFLNPFIESLQKHKSRDLKEIQLNEVLYFNQKEIRKDQTQRAHR